MSDHESSQAMGDLLDHEYDGIREYDNPCPSWWSWLFFLTAVFSALYFFYFHIGSTGLSVEKALEDSKADDLRSRFAKIGELKPDEATLLEYMQKPEWLQVGVSVYEQRCKSCHGDQGRGLVGPNLTDDYYKNVKQLTDLVKVVSEGAANGSMPAWQKRLHPNEVVLVAAYLATLRGQNLPGPRGQEGTAIAPWPSSPTVATPAASEPQQPEAGQPTAAATTEATASAADTTEPAAAPARESPQKK